MIALDYILESRTHQLTVEQAETKHLVKDPRLGRRPVPFGFQNQRWRTFLFRMQSGDELWEYHHYIGPLCAEGGVAIIRHGEVIDHFVTSRS